MDNFSDPPTDEEIALSIVSEGQGLRRLGINPDLDDIQIGLLLEPIYDRLIAEERELRLERQWQNAE